jgi:hypothetical protein
MLGAFDPTGGLRFRNPNNLLHDGRAHSFAQAIQDHCRPRRGRRGSVRRAEDRADAPRHSTVTQSL